MTEFIFTLNKMTFIFVTVPDVPEKLNYYYKPADNLNKFDEATAVFVKKNEQIELEKDILQEIILPFYLMLQSAIAKQLYLPEGVKAGNAGRELNKSYNDMQHEDVSSFGLWENRNHIATLLYNASDTIYLEIVPLYKWSYVEPKAGDAYITFDEFMKNYKPYHIEVIPQDIAITWQKKCNQIINKTDIMI